MTKEGNIEKKVDINFVMGCFQWLVKNKKYDEARDFLKDYPNHLLELHEDYKVRGDEYKKHLGIVDSVLSEQKSL